MEIPAFLPDPELKETVLLCFHQIRTVRHHCQSRAGTGGDEAALFAYDLFRCTLNCLEQNRWKTEVLSTSVIHVGGAGKTSMGYKEVVCQISGDDAYRYLRHESGVHRVQRVPLTEYQGRIHTSASTVAIMPVAEAVDVEINNGDLRIDTYRSSGAGGQHVNTTDSAIRITHLPQGSLLPAKTKNHSTNKAGDEFLLPVFLGLKGSTQRKFCYKKSTGRVWRSIRANPYGNYPQNRITDHRINLTLYKRDRFMKEMFWIN